MNSPNSYDQVKTYSEYDACRNLRIISNRTTKSAIRALSKYLYLRMFARFVLTLLPEKVNKLVIGGAKSIIYSRIDENSPIDNILIREFSYAFRRKKHLQTGLNRKQLKLAFFSPLPPVRSGISYYSSALIPSLSKHYHIDLIVDQKNVEQKDKLEKHCKIRDVSWFLAHGAEYDRIIYQVGNSSFHAYMMQVMKVWPGIVVLHDFYLGHLVCSMDIIDQGVFLDNLYTGWGFTALYTYCNEPDRENILCKFPLNARTLQNALGVIVHSESCLNLTAKYYKTYNQKYLYLIPLVTEVVPHKHYAVDIRIKHSIPDDAFICCSFGYLSPYKLCENIISAWKVSSLNSNTNCWLIFVGEPNTGEYKNIINSVINKAGNPRILVTGWVSNDAFRQYLSVSNMAIQLRKKSRGETSSAVLGCMERGVPTIVNTHGSMTELPDEVVFKIPDKFTNLELSKALENLLHNVKLRKSLGILANQFIARDHNPVQCAYLYFDAVERIYVSKEETWNYFNNFNNNNSRTELSNLLHMQRKLENSLHVNPCTCPQLLVDVSVIVHKDYKSGIQRVVRAQLLELIRNPPCGYRVEPVYLHKGAEGWQYLYARSYGCSLLDIPDVRLTDEKVDFCAEDVLYIADFSPDKYLLASQDSLYNRLKTEIRGIYILVYDILPIRYPQFFPDKSSEKHNEWIVSISQTADKLIFISHTVVDEYRRWRENNACKVSSNVETAVNYLGADIRASKPTTGFKRGAKILLRKISNSPTFLMVGTIEPRKGYMEALDAFESLWMAGVKVNLVIVGAVGWKNLPDKKRKVIPRIVKRLKNNSELNNRLFWLNGISDEYLEAVYARSVCLVAASVDEGFGLPLIEASTYNVPIIARDIPIFHEIAGEPATYFGGSQKPLQSVLSKWLEEYSQGKVIQSSNIPVRTWSDNSETLKELLGFTSA